MTAAAANGRVNVAVFLQDQLLLDLERQTEETDEAHDKADDRVKELNATEGRAANRRTEIILSPDLKEIYKLLEQ